MIAADRDAVIAAARSAALAARPLSPSRIPSRQRSSVSCVVAAVGFGLDVERQTLASGYGMSASRDQVAPAELDAVDAELARRDVDQPLAEEIGLEPAGPAVGAGRRLVRHQQRDVDVDVGECGRARDITCAMLREAVAPTVRR